MAVPAGFYLAANGFYYTATGAGPYTVDGQGKVHLVGQAADHYLDVGFSAWPTRRRVVALGNNPDVDTTTTPEDIWPGGGAYPWITAAGGQGLQVRSTSAQDSATGTGISSISVGALDSTYAEKANQTVALNGLTPVVMTDTNYKRINFARAVGKGSGAADVGVTNVGDIIIEDVGGGTIRAMIPAGAGFIRQAVYTVPLGFTLSIRSMFFSFNNISSGVAKFARFATYSQNSSGVYALPFIFALGDEPPWRQDGDPGIILTEKTDFAIRCLGVSNDNTDLTAAFLGVLKSNTEV